jgi:hypothetical protein
MRPIARGQVTRASTGSRRASEQMRVSVQGSGIPRLAAREVLIAR